MSKSVIVQIPSSTKDISPEKKLSAARAAMETEYRRRHGHPWIIAYSGGKDSTLLLQLAFELLLKLPAEERKRDIYVISNDTLVESPLVIEHLKNSLKLIRKAAFDLELPMTAKLTRPCIDQTFWVNVIGKGYIPPTRSFRWCTDRMKILPTGRLIEKIVRTHGEAILLIGTRKSESAHRRRNIERREASGSRLNQHGQIRNCRVFSPIVELEDDDVWMELMQTQPPWGGTHQDLITLYRNACGGECPVVLSKVDTPSCGTTSPRFGCWTCTVVQKDRSLEGLVNSGFEIFEPLLNFRDWLQELREDNQNRTAERRDGSSRYRSDGSKIYGPFKIEVRKRILDGLRKLEQTTQSPLISDAEVEIIYDIWRRDQIRLQSRTRLLNVLGVTEAAA